MPKPKHIAALAGGVIFFLLIVLIAVKLGGSHGKSTEETDAQISAGVAYLQGLEQQDPDQVDQILKQQRLQKLQDMRDERLRQLESGEISVWSLFEDYVLCGDSRAEGFSFYGFLPEERVIAETGANLEHLAQHVPDIAALNPSNIFLCYGLNDIGMYATVDDFSARFTEILNDLHTRLPDAVCYISSIIPAYAGSVTMADIAPYNTAMSALCDMLPYCTYVDNSETASKYTDLWEPDQINVQRDFYPHWATDLIMAVYNAGLEEDQSSSTAN